MNARIASSGTMSTGFLSRRKLAGRPAPNMNAYDISRTLHNGVRACVWYTESAISCFCSELVKENSWNQNFEGQGLWGIR